MSRSIRQSAGMVNATENGKSRTKIMMSRARADRPSAEIALTLLWQPVAVQGPGRLSGRCH